jgi:hypothetical protein
MVGIFKYSFPTLLQRVYTSKDKQRSTKHTHKTTNRVTRTPLKPGVNLDDPEGKACYELKMLTWMLIGNIPETTIMNNE